MVAVLPPVPPVPVMKHQKNLPTPWVRRYLPRRVAKWSPLLKARKKGPGRWGSQGLNIDDMEMVHIKIMWFI